MVYYNPLYTINNQGFFIAQLDGLENISNSQFLPQVARLPVLGKKVFAPVMIDVFHEKTCWGVVFWSVDENVTIGASRHFFQNKDWQFLQGS